MATGYKRSVLLPQKGERNIDRGKAVHRVADLLRRGTAFFPAGGYVGLFCVIQAGIASEAGSQLMLEPLRRKKKIGCLVRSQLL